MMLRNILVFTLALVLMGCGSTNNSVKKPSVKANKGVEKLVKYSILEPELADMMALKAEQSRLDRRNEFKNSALGVVSGDGSLVDGFLLSSVIGAGFSLGDFLSPTNIILASLSVKKEWKKHETNVLFIAVSEDCSEECAIRKLTDIAIKQRTRQYQIMNLTMPSDLTVHSKNSGMWSKKRVTYHLIDDEGNNIALFGLSNPAFFELEGQRYYGANPAGDKPSDSRWYFGYYKEEIDHGLYALIEVSREHDELFTYMPKAPFAPSKLGEPRVNGCRGNFIVQNGKLELIYQMFGCLAFADEKNAPPESLIIYQ